MKKLLRLFLFIALVILLVGCKSEPTIDTGISSSTLHIYYLNDTHGAIEKTSENIGLAGIGNLILDEKSKYPDEVLFIGGGDILQGNILSNYYYGASMIDTFNHIGMDAFVLGNHEFDWGLDQVTRYFDPNYDDVKATFPLLGANIIEKSTGERPLHVDAYTIIQKGSVKVGIIGLMGYGLENSIATSRVEPYRFEDPIYWASHYANYLRTEEDVDIVLAVIHGSDQQTNTSLASLSGNQTIDAIFNGHSHSRYTETISRATGDVPVIQSRHNGEYLGHVTLNLNEDKTVYSVQVRNLSPTEENSNPSDRIIKDIRLATEHPTLLSLIGEYRLAIIDLLTEVITTSDSTYSSYELTTFMAKLMRVAVDADVGIHNYQGTRSSLESGQDITVATLYEIFPFDNRIKYVYITGSDIKDFANSSVAMSYRDGLSLSLLEDDTYYLVATNDYIFDKIYNPFIYGEDPIDTGILVRDLLEDVMRQQEVSYDGFNINHPIVMDDQPTG